MSRIGVAGQLWTIVPTVVSKLRPPRAHAGSRPWSLAFEDPEIGAITLTGVEMPGTGDRAVLLLHGLGGSADSAYLFAIEHALVRRGWTTLRLHQRGADRRGEDIHHAGFIADLPRVLAAAPFAAARAVAIVGISLGGHVALRYAADEVTPRLAAVASVCSPLDLDQAAFAIDRPAAWLYRRHLLQSVNEIYAAVHARGRGSTPIDKAAAARSLREWDGLVIAPRFGFESAADYYARESVGPRLGSIRVPTWIVASEGDPMVPAATLRGPLAGASPAVEVTWTRRGGHVGFPADLDLGRPGERGLPGQLASWLEERVPAVAV